MVLHKLFKHFIMQDTVSVELFRDLAREFQKWAEYGFKFQTPNSVSFLAH